MTVYNVKDVIILKWEKFKSFKEMIWYIEHCFEVNENAHLEVFLSDE